MNITECIKKYKLNEISGEELEELWYQIMHCQPSKRTERTVFQLTFTKHPIKDALEQLKSLSPSHIKKGIQCCIKCSKQWWAKTSDTYLFPSAAITLFLYSPSPSGYELIPECTPKSAVDCYTSLINRPGPNNFTRYCGTNKSTFPLWDCVGRPGVTRMAHLYKEAMAHTLHLDVATDHAQLKAMVLYGQGEVSDEELWEQTLHTLHSLGCFPSMSQKTDRTPKYDLDVLHVDGNVKYHHRFPKLPGGWSTDVILSGLQTMIRRDRLKDALWLTSQILCCALFHKKVTNLWTLYSGGQSKITNLLNRLLVITVEDCYPDALLFVAVSSHVEEARTTLLALKTPQLSELYMERFSKLCSMVFPIVCTLCAMPKARVTVTRMQKFIQYYNQAKESLPVETKKRRIQE